MGTQSIIDTERYPLKSDPPQAAAELVASVRGQLKECGCAVLPGFIRAEVLPKLAAEVAALAPLAYFSQARVNVYGRTPETDFPAEHPRGFEIIRKNGFVAGDHIAPGSLSRSLYHDTAFKEFLAACIEAPVAHEFADPLAQIVVNVIRPEELHTWHFDSNDFAVTILTQAPQSGGEFQYVPRIRSAGEENYPAVQSILKGSREGVVSFDLRPGDLQLFFGRYSLHRVAPTHGLSNRHTLVLAYSREAGVMGRASKSLHLFGRASADSTKSDSAPPREDELLD
jgi:hypothetical protein